MRRFRLDDMIVEEAAPNFQDILANARRRQIRPLCLCREPGVSMCIARVANQYVVKRMPLSGGGHDSTCASYEPPDDLSGLGALVGNAIQVDGDTGLSALKLGFSLTKVGPRARQVAGSGDSTTAVGTTRKLSLCSMLNYLWHQAELTAWMSRWTGKRQWWNIRWHLLEAARQMTVRDAPLSDVLFVPEPFRAADKAGLEKRRAAALSGALPPRTGPRKLMVLIGEIKKFERMRNGQRMLIKHLPDLPFMLHDKLYSRLLIRFENEFALSDGDQTSHLPHCRRGNAQPALLRNNIGSGGGRISNMRRMRYQMRIAGSDGEVMENTANFDSTAFLIAFLLKESGASLKTNATALRATRSPSR